MARRYAPPACVAPDAETGVPCGARMTALGERDPSFGPRWTPGTWVFRCRRCGAMRAIEKERIAHYLGAV